jgi:hypothetical protein
MYVMDAKDRAKYPYLENFVAFRDGGYYVHLPEFIKYIDTNHKDAVDTVEYIGRFVYFVRGLADPTKPYIAIFQSCNVMRTPMIPFEIGQICIFIAHFLEKDPTLV